MAFPTNPTNGQTANVNGIVYTYSSSLTAWQVTTTFSGNVTVDQLNSNVVSAAGNVTGANLVSVGAVVSGNVSGGNLIISGVGSFSGNITAVSILPAANATHDLGSTAARWRNIYTSDLDLNNGIGDWTIVEGEDDLFLYNNKKGKTYKFALVEVDPAAAPPKINNLKK